MGDGVQHGHLRKLRGTQPGLLDPSQPSRLLRFPDSSLFFASFDPKTALAEDPNSPKYSSHLTPPKRIIIETTEKGAIFWRFVPRARLEEGAQDEGVWPRVIDICGEKVQCYQEQWEIYKLDSRYHCVVYPWPKCSTITWAEQSNRGSAATDPYSGKRSRWSSPETSEPAAQKKVRSRPMDGTDYSSFGSDEDEDEVEEMIVDESFSRKIASNSRHSVRRDRIDKTRRERWEKIRTLHQTGVQDTTILPDGSFSMRVDSDDIPTWPTEEYVKRKGDPSPESDNESDRVLNAGDQSPRVYKRARTAPLKNHREANQNQARREKRRLDKLRRYRQQQEKKFDGFSFVPSESVFEGGDDHGETHSEEKNDKTPLEVDPHEVEIAESIRKIRELEKDRPLWEAERKQREARERAEEQDRLVRAERRRKEEEQRQRRQREAAEQEKLAQEEAGRRAREEELRQHEIHRQRQRQRWESGLWTTHRALERYRVLSEEFDAAKFTSGRPVTFHDVPWPVLHAPSRLTVEDVDWSAVEAFFATVKSHMRQQDYREFVEKSHRRFHPDRWRARRIWAAVVDEVERGYLEVAANTVAQAITPIWRTVKER